MTNGGEKGNEPSQDAITLPLHTSSVHGLGSSLPHLCHSSPYGRFAQRMEKGDERSERARGQTKSEETGTYRILLSHEIDGVRKEKERLTASMSVGPPCRRSVYGRFLCLLPFTSRRRRPEGLRPEGFAPACGA